MLFCPFEIGLSPFFTLSFGLVEASWNSTMIFSTSAFGLEYCALEDSIISFTNDISGCGIGGNVVAENGLDVSPSIINLRYICAKPKLTKSSRTKIGANSFSNTISASVAPTLKAIIVPALPITAALTTSSICSIYW